VRRGTDVGDVLLLVPEAECNVLEAMGIGDTSNAIFTPSEGAGPGMFVWEVYIKKR
jgi:hypothetical protein